LFKDKMNVTPQGFITQAVTNLIVNSTFQAHLPLA